MERWNVLAGEVIVSGSIRSYSSDMQNYLKRGLAHLAEQFYSAATISFRYNDGYPAVINHSGLYAALSDSNKLHELEGSSSSSRRFWHIYATISMCIFLFRCR